MLVGKFLSSVWEKVLYANIILYTIRYLIYLKSIFQSDISIKAWNYNTNEQFDLQFYDKQQVFKAFRVISVFWQIQLIHIDPLKTLGELMGCVQS